MAMNRKANTSTYGLGGRFEIKSDEVRKLLIDSKIMFLSTL